MTTIRILEACDAVTIYIDKYCYHITQDDTHEKLVEMFNQLGFEVEYEEVY